MKNVVIIPSGGIGSRFNSPIPKQYVQVLGKELIAYTIETFQKCSLVDEIIISAHESFFDLLNTIKKKYNFSKISTIVKGGKERQDSVYNGLLSKKFNNDDLIIVHDAARPLLSQKLLTKSINIASKKKSIVVAIKARDTLIDSSNKEFAYLDRSQIYYAQTPQIFEFSILDKAFKIANKNRYYGTDESMLVKNANFDVHIVDGEFINFKITTPSDLELMQNIVK